MAASNPKEGFTRLVVDVPIEMKDDLQSAALSQDLTMSQLVRRVLGNALEVGKEQESEES